MPLTHHAPRTTIRIVTRGSALALAQANMVLAQCRAAFPTESFEITIIKTTGDKLQTASLASANLPKGLFTKELEAALLNGNGDLAVHSLKDLPTDLRRLKPALPATGRRARRVDPPREFTIHRSRFTIHVPPPRATVATSSTRRAAQLLDRRPDLNIVPIRGNVGTRLRKLAEQSELAAIVLAAAGLERLHFRSGDSAEIFGNDVPPGLLATAISVEEMLPCVGQAALGIEIRENDPRLEEFVQRSMTTRRACVTAERAFRAAWGGGCQLQSGVCEIVGAQLRLRRFHGRKTQGERSGKLPPSAS
jgi:hydroxymethylbilane synthase